MTRRPLVLVAGGGTGGHVFPGLAAAEALVAAGARVAFVGTARGIETRVLADTPWDLHLVPGAPVRGGGLGRAVRGLALTARGIAAARALVRRLRPDAVLGVGGYASVAAVVAARLARIPVVLQEQNAVPGIANRWLAHLADRVCVGFGEAAAGFPVDRVVHTGNPVRRQIAVLVPAPPSGDRCGLLVFGGSQGARRLNDAAVAAVSLLGDRRVRLTVVHQTGVADVGRVRAAYAAAGVPAEVHAFIDDQAAAYAAADLVVARAGAMTCAEITVAGLPAVLVPYPHASGDHQRRNAAALVDAGAAEVLTDDACDGPHLAAALGALVDDGARRQAMAEAARAIARPDAARRVAQECLRAASLEARRALR